MTKSLIVLTLAVAMTGCLGIPDETSHRIDVYTHTDEETGEETACVASVEDIEEDSDLEVCDSDEVTDKNKKTTKKKKLPCGDSKLLGKWGNYSNYKSPFYLSFKSDCSVAAHYCTDTWKMSKNSEGTGDIVFFIEQDNEVSECFQEGRYECTYSKTADELFLKCGAWDSPRKFYQLTQGE